MIFGVGFWGWDVLIEVFYVLLIEMRFIVSSGLGIWLCADLCGFCCGLGVGLCGLVGGCWVWFTVLGWRLSLRFSYVYCGLLDLGLCCYIT